MSRFFSNFWRNQVTLLYWCAAQQQSNTCRRQQCLFCLIFNVEFSGFSPSLKKKLEVAQSLQNPNRAQKMYVYVFCGLSEKQASRFYSNSEISELISYEYNGILDLIHSMLPDCIVTCQKYSRFIGFYRQYAASMYGKEDTIPTGKEDNWPNTITACISYTCVLECSVSEILRSQNHFSVSVFWCFSRRDFIFIIAIFFPRIIVWLDIVLLSQSVRLPRLNGRISN